MKGTFVVSGTGYFPTDMLRYDACWPATTEDASKIMDSFINGDTAERREVTLNTASIYSPSRDRWKSNLWTVT